MTLEPNQWRVLAVLITDISIACYVLYKNPKSRINQYWFATGLLLFITNFRDFAIPFTRSPGQAIAIVQFVEFGIFLLPTALWLFVNQLYDQVLEKGWRRTWTFIYFLSSLSIYALSFIPAINNYVTFQVGSHYVARPGVTASFAFAFYQIALFVGVVYAIKAYAKANSSLKRKIRIVFMSIVVFAVAETDFISMSQLTPTTLNYGYLAVMAGNVMIAYAIVRHRVMDIVIILRKSLAYSVAMAVLAGVYVACIRLGEVILQSQRPDISTNVGITVVAIILIAVTFEPLRAVVQRVVDRLFFKTRYEYQEAIKQFSHMVVTILDLDLLLHRTAITIQDILKIQQATIFIHNSEVNKYEIGAFAGVDEKKLRDWNYNYADPLPERLRLSNRRVQDLNDAFGSSVVVSLFINRDLIGFLVLGEKLSGDAYSPTDFDLLSTLADQLAIAIENARLYKAAVTDKVTKVFTGAYFYDRLDEELARSREQGTKLSVVFFDADGFLNLSKNRGAGTANQALSVMGAVIRKNSHVYDIAARIGDDEFGVIMPGADRTAALFAAKLIGKEIKNAEIDGEPGLVTVSIGIAFTERGAKSSRRLINDARKALLTTKAKNKTQTLMFGND